MNGDIDRLYIPRSEGGKGLMGVEDCVTHEDISLREYIHGLPDSALSAIAKETCKEPDTSSKEAKRNTRLQRKARFREKVMHGQFERQTEGVRDHESTFRWLRCSNLKRETEALIMAAQEQSLRTNSIKCHIDKTRQSDKCRMCQHARETTEHLVEGCEKLAQREYKRRHDKVAQLVHWNILRNDGIETTTTWYKHLPQQVIENQHAKVLWDFNIQADNVTEARRPDIVRIDQNKRQAPDNRYSSSHRSKCSNKGNRKVREISGPSCRTETNLEAEPSGGCSCGNWSTRHNTKWATRQPTETRN